MYFSSKTYGHERGLSCAFRQPTATSHCNMIHGYALSFQFTFGCAYLDENNWVVDFGGLKKLKEWLEFTFDHTLAIAEKDPHIDKFRELDAMGLVSMRVMDGVGCEKFAEHAFKAAQHIIKEQYGERCWVQSVECKEHGANGAVFANSEGR